MLDQLASGGEKYEDWKYDRYPNLPEVLNQFHSLKLDAAHLIMTLPLLQCVSNNRIEYALFVRACVFNYNLT